MEIFALVPQIVVREFFWSWSRPPGLEPRQ